MVWTSKNKTKRGYAFTYDGINRLTLGDFKGYNTAWVDSTAFEENPQLYDYNGNIRHLTRTNSTGGSMADYTYTYKGNQLYSIKTLPSNTIYTYAYDKNGNATLDGLRNFTIAYNILNLPKSITSGTDNIAYIYSAVGNKLVKKKKDGTYQFYTGNMVYKNDKTLNYLLFEEGLVNKSTGGYTYEYHLKDHLGNTRISFQPNGSSTTLTQVAEYYPFGSTYLPIYNGSGTSNKYLYNGKEKQDDLLGTGSTALDWYDYGARFYDPTIGRWHSIDPLASMDVNSSPYNYALNNPVNLLDPDGLSTHTDSTGNVLAVYNDHDNGVYSHKTVSSSYASKDGETETYTDPETGEEKTREKSKLSGGDKRGSTENWDEFVSPETGNTMTGTKIMFGQTWDGPIGNLSKQANGMDLKEIASNSAGGGLFDLKKDYPNQGRLLNGKYASSRSAGNYLAGYNAASATYFGTGVSFETFQKLAGALHVMESQGKRLTTSQKADIVIFGTSYGPAPGYGEQLYQYRMSQAGWHKKLEYIKRASQNK